MSQRPIDPEDIQIGDPVRWTDTIFDRVIEGVVRDIQEEGARYWRYHIEIDKETIDGQAVPIRSPRFLRPLVNGSHLPSGSVYNQTKKLRTAECGRGRVIPRDVCECGAAKLGYGKGSAGHSSWCPWA